jgi:hypothetical protein
MGERSETRECPFCKEEIMAEAIKCKHCGSRVTPERPGHRGICPFCKEEIHPDAIRCKHCHSDLSHTDPGCDCGSPWEFRQRQVGGALRPSEVALLATPAMQQTGPGFPPGESACSQLCWLQCMQSPPPGVPGGDPILGGAYRDPFLCWYLCGVRCGERRDPRDWRTVI